MFLPIQSDVSHQFHSDAKVFIQRPETQIREGEMSDKQLNKLVGTTIRSWKETASMIFIKKLYDGPQTPNPLFLKVRYTTHID